MEKIMEIDLKRLLFELWRKIWVIFLVALLAGSALYMYAKVVVTPKYTASIKLYVNNYIEGVSQDVKKISSGDLATAQSLVQTYKEFLTSDKVLDEVAAELDEDYSASALRGMISFKKNEDTEIFQVKITHPNPEEAARIANKIADKAPEVITSFIDGSSVKVVDYAKVPTARSYPSYMKFGVAGAAAGAGIVILIIALLFIFSAKIDSAEEIETIFSIPVIGKIPNFSHSSGSENYYYSYRYAYKTRKQAENGGYDK